MSSRELHTDYVVTSSLEANMEEEIYDLVKHWKSLMYFHNKGLLADPPGNFEYTIHREPAGIITL
eukprot:9538588-Prorocentrum_lima.AAC.1